MRNKRLEKKCTTIKKVNGEGYKRMKKVKKNKNE